MKTKAKIFIFAIVHVAFSALGIYYLFKSAGSKGFGPDSFLWSVPVIIIAVFIIRKIRKSGRLVLSSFDKRRVIFSAVFSYLLALSFFAGYSMRYYLMTPPGVRGKISMLCRSLFLAVCFFPFMDSLFMYADRISVGFPGRRKIKEAAKNETDAVSTEDSVNSEGTPEVNSEDTTKNNPEVKSKVNPEAITEKVIEGTAEKITGENTEIITDENTEKTSEQIKETVTEKPKAKWPVKGVFFVSWAGLFLLWIPVFLAYYPAIMSYDSNRQFQEAYNGLFWELQPIVHTWLIRMALLIGEQIGSYEVGMSFYTLLQMFVLSGAIAFAISFVYELFRRKWIPIALTAFFGIFPVFSVLAMVVTKDIFFSAFFLVLMVLSIKRFLKKPEKPIVYDIAMVVFAVLMAIFRKNGIYGVVLFAVFYILAMKKERIRILILCIVMVAASFGGIYLTRLALHASPGPKTEMYSVPIQQMGRVVFFKKDMLSKQELDTMEDYLTGCTEWKVFNITLADSQKSCANPDAWTNTPQMIKDWFHFAVRFPDDYIDAYLGLVSGYFFPDDISISQHLGFGRKNMRGLIETFNASKPLDQSFPGVKSESKIPALQYLLEGPVSDEQYLKWPVLAGLFRPAVYCWFAFILYGILLYKKKYREFAAASLQFAYFLTVAMGPVANIRYVFQLMIGLPVLIAFVIISLREKQEAS